MSSKKVRVVVQGGDGRNVVQDLALHGQAPRIKVQPKVKYLLQGHDDGLGPENVTATRVGHDLHIALEGESSPGLILEDYFSGSDVEGLFGGAEDGRLHSYVPTDGGEIFDLAEGEPLPLGLGSESHGAGAPSLIADSQDGGFGFLPLALLGGLAGLGLSGAFGARGPDGVDLPAGEAPAPSAPLEPEADAPAAEDLSHLVTETGEFAGLVFDVQAGDRVDGGSGDDLMRITATDFARLDGGGGIDMLVLDGSDMHVDLSALGSKVQHIEKFDLGAGHNTLALKAGDVLANGQADMVLQDGRTQMVVNGAQGEVDLLDGLADGWSSHGATTVGGMTYNVYTNLAGTAELLVEDRVQVAIL
jgi:hypothetical protein